MIPADSSSIPILTDVLVPGDAALRREPVAPAMPVPTDALAARGGPAYPEDADVVVHPVPTPDVPAIELEPPVFAETEPAAHRAEAGATQIAAIASISPDLVPDALPPAAFALTPEDAQHVAERLRNRLTTYLTGEGREAIEARCRDALHDHTAWLVNQITREVALALETEVMEWVRDAIDDEIARRRAG